ncbi:hypothetical protein CKO44_01175 [Rubrivivax gelatinosus]|nr:hypothetical protein [Rubrivivax gelatinosus]MBZ8143108.1 hypothetical protein [Rubrivivax gelatinosus]
MAQAMAVAQLKMAVARAVKEVDLQQLRSIKAAKRYRIFKGQSGLDPNGNAIEDLGTWEGFCRALGMSVDKVDEDLLNLDTFGAEALERLVLLGAGYRELRQYRKLPDAERAALVDLARTADRRRFFDQAAALVAQHQRQPVEAVR